ncbi:hypothetical protein AB0H43_03765 [Hamadaea sp. NPDC050747]|uniref:hypothetical protein n=1 Tax=Hamadaea sp. NPDC050747 TaxID=3155789 RepID=UPI0033D542BC
MNGAWVAGSVRAQAMARRRLGVTAARALGRSASLTEALAALAASPYGRHVRLAAGLAAAQHGVLDALLWNLRVLAGWLPPAGVRSLRALAGWFEIANVDEHVAQLTGRAAEEPFRLGVLGSAWPRLSETGSRPEVRRALAASAWGDPGSDDPSDISLTMRVAWARRVVSQVDQAVPWALGATGLLVAGHVHDAGGRLPETAARGVDALLGPEWAHARDLADLCDRLPARARWVLTDVHRPEQLWHAEAAWWRRLHTDGSRLIAGGRFGPDRPIGAVALLAADAWQVRAALALAARTDVEQEDADVLA